MWWKPEEERAALVDYLIPAALMRLDGTMRDSDAVDTKALGTLAVDAAAIALLVTQRDVLHHLWWLPGCGFILSAAFLIGAIWPRRFDFGPDIDIFYSRLGENTPIEASRQMLAEVLASISFNEGIRKIGLYYAGLAVLMVSLVACLPVALVRPSDSCHASLQSGAHGHSPEARSNRHTEYNLGPFHAARSQDPARLRRARVWCG